MNQFLLFVYSLLFSFLCYSQSPENYTVHLDTDKHLLTSFEDYRLTSFLDELDYSSITKIEFKGHTDSDRSNKYNSDLAGRRTSKVMEYLTKTEYAAEVDTSSFGEDSPLNSNLDDTEKSKNRRVDMMITYLPKPEVLILALFTV